MKTYLFPVVVEIMEKGGYYAECPILQGCHVEGTTYNEALENLQDAIQIFIQSYKELGKELPEIPVYDGTIVVSSNIPVPVGA